MYVWSRRVKRGESYFEVSTKGDKRFSPLVARFKDGFTIEEVYQLDVKGYRTMTNDWMYAKKKPPLHKMTEDELYTKYKNLWSRWFKENPVMLETVAELAKDTTITDMFATGDINQAHAICDLLNERIVMGVNKRFNKRYVQLVYSIGENSVEEAIIDIKNSITSLKNKLVYVHVTELLDDMLALYKSYSNGEIAHNVLTNRMNKLQERSLGGPYKKLFKGYKI